MLYHLQVILHFGRHNEKNQDTVFLNFGSAIIQNEPYYLKSASLGERFTKSDIRFLRKLSAKTLGSTAYQKVGHGVPLVDAGLG
jgi:hypothetical protein